MDDSIKSSPHEYVYDDFDRIPTDDEDTLEDERSLVIAEDDEGPQTGDIMPSSLTEALAASKYGPTFAPHASAPPSPLQVSFRKPCIVSPNRHDRMRLRPWLIRQIDSGQHPGLGWLNDDKSLFRIPWMHRSKREWTLEHSGIFVEWAKHTGKYRPGIDTPDFVHMKTRLRCAFNKAPDIEEVAGIQKVKNDIPFKVYQLLPLGSNKFATMPGKPESARTTKMRMKKSLNEEISKRPLPALVMSNDIHHHSVPSADMMMGRVDGMVPSPEQWSAEHADTSHEDERATHPTLSIRSSEAAAAESLVNLGGSSKASLARSCSSQGNVVYILGDGTLLSQNKSNGNTVPNTPESLPAFEELLPAGAQSTADLGRVATDGRVIGELEFVKHIKQEEQSDYGGDDSPPQSPVDDAVGALLSLHHREDALPLRTEVLDLRSKIEDRKPEWDGTGVLDLSTRRPDDETDAPSVPKPDASDAQQPHGGSEKCGGDVARPTESTIQGWSVTAEGLQSRFSELIDLENKLMDYKVALDSRAATLAGKESQLAEREAALASQQKILDHQRKELSQRVNQVEEQDSGVREKEEEIQACEKQLRLKEELLSCKEKRLKLELDNIMTAISNGQHGNPAIVNTLLSQSRLLNPNGESQMFGPPASACHGGVVPPGHAPHGVVAHPPGMQPHFPAMMPPVTAPGHMLPIGQPQVASAHHPLPMVFQAQHAGPRARGMITRPARAPMPGLHPHPARILPNVKPSPRAEVSPVQSNHVSPQMAVPARKVSVLTPTKPTECQSTSPGRRSADRCSEKVAYEAGAVDRHPDKHSPEPGDMASLAKSGRTHTIIQNLRKRVYSAPTGPDIIATGPAKKSRILPPV